MKEELENLMEPNENNRIQRNENEEAQNSPPEDSEGSETDSPEDSTEEPEEEEECKILLKQMKIISHITHSSADYHEDYTPELGANAKLLFEIAIGANIIIVVLLVSNIL